MMNAIELMSMREIQSLEKNRGFGFVDEACKSASVSRLSVEENLSKVNDEQERIDLVHDTFEHS